MEVDDFLTQNESYKLSLEDTRCLNNSDAQSATRIVEEARKTIYAYQMNLTLLYCVNLITLFSSLFLYGYKFLTNLPVLVVVCICIFGASVGLLSPKIDRLAKRSKFLIGVVVELPGPAALSQMLVWFTEVMGTDQIITAAELYKNTLRSVIRNMHILTEPSFSLPRKAHRTLYRIVRRASGAPFFGLRFQQSGISEEIELVKLVKPLAHTLFSEGEISKLGWTDS